MARTPPRPAPATPKTPNQDELHDLARLSSPPQTPSSPQTPSQAQATLATARRSARRTPGAGRLLPRPAKSPYVKRAFEQSRRLTPGRERRKSNAGHRESDRDFLRMLSRQLAPTSEVPQATPGPAPRSVRRGPRAPSDVVFYDPASMGEVGDEDEDAVQVPQFSYNPNDYDDDEDDEHRASPLATAPRDGEASARRYGRRSSVEAGRRAVTKRQSDFGFQLEDAFEDFGDASFGVGQGDDTVGMDESMRQIEFGGNSSRLSAGSDRRISIIEDHDQTFDDGMMMLPPSDDSEHYQLEGMPEDDGEGERYTGGDMEDGEEDDYELESFGNMEQEDQDERPGYQQIEPGIDSDGSVRLQPEKKKKKGKAMNVSESGTEYPPFPKRVIKKLASKAGDKISNETLNALSSYTRLFFEQAAGDLGAYARHAGRKTIEDADALQLLRRQKQINLQTTAFSLAQKHLPRELSQEIRMPVANKVLRKRFRKSE